MAGSEQSNGATGADSQHSAEVQLAPAHGPDGAGEIGDVPAGRIEMTLRADIVPETANNFLKLAKGTLGKTKRYKGSRFHRVIPGFMCQGGDFTRNNGTGGESIWGGKFNDEIHPENQHTTRGIVSMANSGPDTNGSQFFITDRATPHHLDGKHTIFGKCQDLDVVEAIATTDKGPGDRPRTDVVVRKLRILRGAAAKGL